MKKNKIIREREFNKVNIIFCGLIRNPEMFKKSLKDFTLLRKKGLVNKIILSTWDYEIDKYNEMRKYLNKNKVILIESKEPEEKGIGNIFCQMKTLDVGLKIVDKNSFVLKTRTDLYIDPIFLKRLFSNKTNLLKIKHDLPKGNIFKYKVWIPYFEITNPFHMGDECFFGNANDIKMLVNYINYSNYYKLRAGIAHIQRYIHPFINEYSIIKTFFLTDSNVGLPKDQSLSYKFMKKLSRHNNFLRNFVNSLTIHSRFRTLRKRLKDSIYLETLAVYYTILYSHFYIDNNGVLNELNDKGIWKRNFAPEKKVGGPELMDNFKKDRISVKSKGHVYSFNEEFLKNIFEKREKQNNITADNLLRFIDNFNIH